MSKVLDTLQGIIQEDYVIQCGLIEPSARHRRLQHFPGFSCSAHPLICLHSHTCGVCSKALQLTILLPERVLVHDALYIGNAYGCA